MFGSNRPIGTWFTGRKAARRVTALIIAGTLAGACLVDASTASAQVPSERPDDTAFIARTYLLALGRPADAGSIGWVNALLAGAGISNVVRSIVRSNEGLTKTVNDNYRSFLNRNADPGGLASSVAFLANGGTVEQLQASILASSEYGNRTCFFGLCSTGLWVASVFQNVLGRAASTSDLSAWAKAAQSSGRYNAAYAIITSDEAKALRTQYLYEWALDRFPASSEVNSWVRSVDTNHISLQDEEIDFLASAMGLNGAPPGPVTLMYVNNDTSRPLPGVLVGSQFYDTLIKTWLPMGAPQDYYWTGSTYVFSYNGDNTRGIDIFTGAYVTAGTYQDHWAPIQGAVEAAHECAEEGGVEGVIAGSICAIVGAGINFF